MEIQVASKDTKPNLKKTKKTGLLSEIFQDYCSHATLHGIGYLGAKDKTLFEKLWWILVFLTSLGFCAYLISRTWMKWVNNPVIVSFSRGQTPVWDIPFPAVTICPTNKVKQNIYNYTNKFAKRKKLTDDERKFFWDVSLVCNLDYFNMSQKDADKTTDENAIQHILDVAPDDFIEVVTWQNEYVDDTELLFKPQLTEEGLCFTSNSFSQTDMFTVNINHDIPFIGNNQSNCGWNIENGYPHGLDFNVYPRRTAQDGLVNGLSIALKSNLKEQDYVCGIPVSGYKLILHNPAEMPRPGQQYITIPFDRLVTVAIQPHLLTTSDGLLKTSPRIRNCYFSHEKSLHFFKVYTQNNCKMECLANMTKANCGCIPFYLPRDNNTLICGCSQLNCISSMSDLIQYYEMLQRERKVPEEERTKLEFQTYNLCHCLPSCSSLHYSAETSQAEIHFARTVLASEDVSYADPKLVDMMLNGELALTQLDIFFKENHFIGMHRSELYGQTDFLANCGGLLGLFLGFSILSIIEIFYFLTIRVYIKLKQIMINGQTSTPGSAL